MKPRSYRALRVAPYAVWVMWLNEDEGVEVVAAVQERDFVDVCITGQGWRRVYISGFTRDFAE